MMNSVKLGKLAPRYDSRTLRLESYLDPKKLPPIPTAFDYGAGVNFPMWLNDRLGDCTCAASAGLIDVWTTKQGKPAVLSDQDVLTAYEAVSGYDPNTGRNDNGAVILDVLKYWAQTGFGGHKLGAYGDVGNAATSLIFGGIFICEGLTVGVQLPEYCLQTDQWLQPSRMTAGGHDVIFTGADGTGNVIGYTWGGRKLTISPAFIGAQVDELHFGLSQDQLDGNGVAANHISLADIQADVAAVGRLDTPPMPAPAPGPGPGPGPTPTPTPTPTPSGVKLADVTGIIDPELIAFSQRLIVPVGHALNRVRADIDSKLAALPW